MRLNNKSRTAKLLFRLDDALALLCNVLLFALVLLAAGLRRLYLLLAGEKPKAPTRILFLSSEGLKVAPARVRSYHFAQVLRQQGVDAFVLAYWDEYARLHHFPFPFRRIWEVEKFFLNLVTLHWLLYKGPLVIVEQRPNYGFIVPLYLKLLNGSRVFMDIDDWILDYLVARPFKRFEVRHMLNFFGLYCDDCIVSSVRLKERLSRNFKSVHLLPTYVDHRRFTPPAGDESGSKEQGGPVVFSWVGTIFQNFTRDNVLFMIEAFARACDQLDRREGLQLDIVGGGDFFKAVEAEVRTRFADYPIRLAPWLAPETMPDYLRSIDVGLYCLVEPSLFQESKSPTKIFEYYACGKPVISTAFGEAKYFVEQGQTGILADTVEEYAQAIARLYLEPETRLAMGG
ncbi:MAG: glycosyltransferase, partial [Humidesulfovibrio sp.]|nr:glycosyltransferase [Humidesulfovibrio sp.]